MDADKLLDDARKAPQVVAGVKAIEALRPVIVELRLKGYTYGAIYEFLQAHGAGMTMSRKSFEQNVSRAMFHVELNGETR